MNKRNFSMALTLLPFTAMEALAHGDAHAKRALSLKKEQKPWGIAGDARAATRTLTVGMADNMRFSPG